MDETFDSEGLARKVDLLCENLETVGTRLPEDGDTICVLFGQWGKKHRVTYSSDPCTLAERVKAVHKNMEIPYDAGYFLRFRSVNSYGFY